MNRMWAPYICSRKLHTHVKQDTNIRVTSCDNGLRQEVLTEWSLSLWMCVCALGHMDVSENSGTPKSSILIGISIIKHPFWGTPIFWNTHMETNLSGTSCEILGFLMIQNILCFTSGIVNALCIIDMGLLVVNRSTDSVIPMWYL